MSVNKKEFADKMAKNGGITKKAAFKAVGLFIDTLLEYLNEDERVMFTGFGRFEMKTAKEKKFVSPKNKEEYIIPEHKRIKFYVSEVLAEQIANQKEVDTYGIK